MQLEMNIPVALPRDAYVVGTRSSGEAHGVVLTKAHVVDLILNLADYTVARDLTKLRLLDPACGHGAFLVPAVERLLSAAEKFGVDGSELRHAIKAYDIDPEHVAVCREAIRKVLAQHKITSGIAGELAESWAEVGDFLLEPQNATYDTVVGQVLIPFCL